MLNVELLAANACHEELWNFEFIVVHCHELSWIVHKFIHELFLVCHELSWIVREFTHEFNIQHLTLIGNSWIIHGNSWLRPNAALKLLSYSKIDKRLEQYRDVKPECWMLSCWRLTPAMKNYGILNLLLCIVTNYRELSINLSTNYFLFVTNYHELYVNLPMNSTFNT